MRVKTSCIKHPRRSLVNWSIRRLRNRKTTGLEHDALGERDRREAWQERPSEGRIKSRDTRDCAGHVSLDDAIQGGRSRVAVHGNAHQDAKTRSEERRVG